MSTTTEITEKAESLCYTVEDLMQMLDASKNTIYKMIREGQFPAIQLGRRGKYRIPKKSFDAWINQQIQ